MSPFEDDKYEYIIDDKDNIAELSAWGITKIRVINIAGCFYLNWNDCRKFLKLPDRFYNSYRMKNSFSFLKVKSTFLPEDQQYSRYISEEAFYDFIIATDHPKIKGFKNTIYEILVNNKAFIKVLDKEKAVSIMSAREERLRELSEELDIALDELFEYSKDNEVDEIWDEIERDNEEKQVTKKLAEQFVKHVIDDQHYKNSDYENFI